MQTKTKKIVQKFCQSAFFAGLAFFLFSGFAYASGQAVGISPLRTEIDIKPGETKLVEYTITNPSDEVIRVEPVIEYYETTDEEGYPVMSGSENVDPQNLTNWVEFDPDPVVVAPGGDVDTTISVTAPANAQPGGRYAAVMYQPVADENAGVQVRVRVASLLVVRVAGRVSENAEITDFSVDQESLSTDKPVVFKTSFKNVGSVHVKPEGKITIETPAGEVLKEVALSTQGDDNPNNDVYIDYLPFNERGGNVLPASERVYLTEWEAPKMNGELVARLTASYGVNNPKEIEKVVSFVFNAGAEVSDFAYDEENNSFSFYLRNTGEVPLRPQFDLAIASPTGFQIDEISYDDDVYLKSNDSKKIEIPWEMSPSSGEYNAAIKFKMPAIQSANTTEVFVVEGGFFSSAFGGENSLGLVLLLVIFAAMSGFFYFLGVQRQKKLLK